MKVLTSHQMRLMDQAAIDDFGIIGPILMENAGLEIFRAILKRFPEIAQENVVIVAGKGNNGGDGFVVARHLYNQGNDPQVFLLGKKADIKGDAKLNLDIILKMGISVSEITSLTQWDKKKNIIEGASLLVDAIFGTGLTAPAAGLYGQIIEDLNMIAAFKVAVDIPSGLTADDFELIGPCIMADLTLTMAAPKVAHIFPPAEDYVGELVVADISMPPVLFEAKELKLELVERKMLSRVFRGRKKDTHKGTFGHLLILAGAMGKTGAAVMAGKAALKMGAGLVTLGTPRSCLPVIARSIVEIMTEPLAETSAQTIAFDALESIQKFSKGKDAGLIGPGISTHESTAQLILDLLPELQIPLVLDADALNILSQEPDVLKSLSHPVVLTPHPGEFARLCGTDTSRIAKEKLELAPKFAAEYGVYLVLKGYKTLIATPDGRVYVNPTGNPGMATGGSGDVLSGMLAAMIMQEKDILTAVLAAVYVHGLAGDLAAEEFGEKSLLAGDLITLLPFALKSLAGKRIR